MPNGDESGFWVDAGALRQSQTLLLIVDEASEKQHPVFVWNRMRHLLDQ